MDDNEYRWTVVSVSLPFTLAEFTAYCARMMATTPTLPDWLPDPTSDAWKRDTDAGKDQKPDPQREARDEAVGRAIKHSP